MAARRIRPSGKDARLLDIDVTDFDLFAQAISLSNAQMRKIFLQRARTVAKRVQADVKGEAPVGRTGYLSRSGVRLSVSRKGIYIRIVGQKGRQPTNIGYLVTRGHRLRGGGRTRPDPFVDRGISKSRGRFEKQMNAALQDVLNFMLRKLREKRRGNRVSSRGRGRPRVAVRR